MFISYNYFRQHNNNQEIKDQKAFYRNFSNEREFGGAFRNIDHLVKSRFFDTFGYLYNVVLRRNPKRILDVGCGNGVNLPLARIFPSVEYHGIDYAESALAAAKEEYKNITFHHGDAFQTGFSDGSFDMVILSSVLILYKEQEDHVRLLSELRRILAPDGVLCLIVWNDSLGLRLCFALSRALGRMFGQNLPEDFMGVHFRPAEIATRAKSAGLVVEEAIHTGVNYGVLECARYLNFSKYNRTFGSAERESGMRHSQNVLRDLRRQAGRWPGLTTALYGMSRFLPSLFSMFSIYVLTNQTNGAAVYAGTPEK